MLHPVWSLSFSADTSNPLFHYVCPCSLHCSLTSLLDGSWTQEASPHFGGLCSLVAQMVKNLPALQETQVWSLGWEEPQRRAWQPTPVFLSGEFCGQRSLVGYKSMGLQSWTPLSDLYFSTRPILTTQLSATNSPGHSSPLPLLSSLLLKSL